MKNRKLRIAWSVSWGIAVVLQITLWVRSYFRNETLSIRVTNSNYISARSLNGKLLTGIGEADVGTRYGIFSHPIYPTSPPDFEVDKYMNHVWTGIGFKRVTWSNFAGLVVPQWFLVLASVVIGGLPWLRISSRFSLGSLLFAMTLVAICLGLIMWIV